MASLRQLAGMKDEKVKQRVEQVLGTIHLADKDKAPTIRKFKNALTPEVLAKADISDGRLVFDRTCAACHTLFDSGGKVGPNLTGSQRTNLDYLLENVVDPNAVVAREYKMTVVVDKGQPHDQRHHPRRDRQGHHPPHRQRGRLAPAL